MLQFLVNKTLQKKGATMIELMAMITIVGLGIGSMFSVVTSGVYFAKDTEDTIKAINLAREGLEGVTNIRNTNWLRFSSDRTNCWRVDGYDSSCIGSSSAPVIYTGSSTLYTVNGLWYLSGITLSQVAPTGATWQTYYTTYRAIQDSEGFFNQTGGLSITELCTNQLQKNCRSIFTREITISPSGTGQVNVKATVRWNTKRMQKVELETILTNWKAKF